MRTTLSQIIIIVLTLLLCSGNIEAVAQNRQFNASDMELVPFDAPSASVSFGGFWNSGNLRAAMQPKSESGFCLDADGKLLLGRFHLSGNFSFRQTFEYGRSFGSCFNPTRDMPYIIVEGSSGNWSKRQYSLWTDISTAILADYLSAGLSLDLDCGRGKGNTLLRPHASMLRFTVKPSLTFNSSEVIALSAAFIYSLYRENCELSSESGTPPQKIYRLKGMGQYDSEILANGKRGDNYAGNTFGGSVRLSHNEDFGSFSLKGEYRNAFERISEAGKSAIVGALRTHDYSAAFLADCSGVGRSSFGFSAAVDYQGYKHSCNEFLPGSYRRREEHVSANVDFFANDREYRRDWLASIGTQWNLMDEDYRAADARMFVSNFRLSYGLGKIFHTRSGFWDLNLGGTWSHGLTAGLTYTPLETEDRLIELGLIMYDYDVPSGWYCQNLSLAYNWKLKNKRIIRLASSGDHKFSKSGLIPEDNIYAYLGANGRYWRSSCRLALSVEF